MWRAGWLMGWRTALTLALLGSAPASDAQDQLGAYRGQMATMPPQPSIEGLNAPAMASTLATWRALQESDQLPFDSYDDFLLAHPGWPGEASTRRAAERRAANASPGAVALFFARFPPQTGAAGVRQAMALASTGQRDAAEAAARKAWRGGALAPADEATLLGTFGAALTPDDHDARMDALLWQGAMGPATRQLALVSAANRDLFAARLALRSNAPQAAALANAGGAWASDAGYVADRAIWLRGASPSAARAWLAEPHRLARPPSDPGRWLQLLLSNARGAAGDGDWRTAYDIARQAESAYPAGAVIAERSYAERDAYTDLVWLGAQAGLKHLGRPADAAPLFASYAGGSHGASLQAKGLYWAARAAQQAGAAEAARGYLTRAAAFHDQFYGQLAAERLGQPLTPPPPFAPPPIDPAARAGFAARETVQAAAFLGRIGDWRDESAFVRQIALDARTDTDRALADELSRSLGRPDLAVLLARGPRSEGAADYSLIGFPTLPVPADAQANWTIIHAIARQESNFDRNATSRAGAKGLMQLMPATARASAGKLGLAWDANLLTASTDYNIQLGASFFDHLHDLYGSYPLAIAAYNAGPGNVNKWLAANGDPRTGAIDWIDWIEAIPFSETRGYVQHVLENAVVYDLISPAHKKSQGPARLSWWLGNRRPG